MFDDHYRMKRDRLQRPVSLFGGRQLKQTAMKRNWAKARAERCASAVCTGFGRISFYPAVRCGDFPVPFPLFLLSFLSVSFN
jgi:hypothetical protein